MKNLPSQYAKQYYQQYVPQPANNQVLHNEQNKVIEKMNYMIHLLEEQQDTKNKSCDRRNYLYSF